MNYDLNRTYEVCLSVNGQKSIQVLEEDNVSVWAEENIPNKNSRRKNKGFFSKDWKIAVEFAIQLVKEEHYRLELGEPTIEFEYVKTFYNKPKAEAGYVFQPTTNLQ
tara:strand:- start:442 stop:762 length:321 start_codon:yes stop_codon:yes gene_type:complete